MNLGITVAQQRVSYDFVTEQYSSSTITCLSLVCVGVFYHLMRFNICCVDVNRARPA
jgi:hypothetical protein